MPCPSLLWSFGENTKENLQNTKDCSNLANPNYCGAQKIVLLFCRKKHQNSQNKWANFMNFSFWPFLWFGLPGRLLNVQNLRKAPDTFNFLRHVMRAILPGRPNCSHRCVSLKESPSKTCGKPPARDQRINRANLYENEMV